MFLGELPVTIYSNAGRGQGGSDFEMRRINSKQYLIVYCFVINQKTAKAKSQQKIQQITFCQKLSAAARVLTSKCDTFRKEPCVLGSPH